MTLAALKSRIVRRALRPVVFGDAAFLRQLPPRERELVTRLPAKDRRPGHPTVAGGRAQLGYLSAAVDAARAGELDALCTAPVSKEGITRTGVPFVGHTELLAEAFGCPVLMLMDGPKLRVALATNHLPLSQVPKALSIPHLVAQLELLSRTLGARLGRRPHIAVCGLNPHAGEGGTMGTEEVRIIAPAIARARALGLACEGPFAADGLFAKADKFPFDVALAMFHDQGLVATKAVDFVSTVNVTLGLPLPRTSPDHGVAYDIAGRHLADERPMVHALLRAAAYAERKTLSDVGLIARSKRR